MWNRVGVVGVVGVAVVAALTMACGDRPPPVARPGDLTGFDPPVAALIEQHAAAAEAQPRDAARHGTLGLVYEANLLLPLAVTSYETASALDPATTRWRYRLAVVRQKSGDIAAALELLRALAPAAPNLAPLQQRLGYALLDSGDLAGAEAAFRSTIALDLRSSQGYTSLGEALYAKRDLAGALETLGFALQRGLGDQSAQYLMGQVYRDLGQRDQAERYLRQGAGGGRAFLPDPQYMDLAGFEVGLASQLDRAASLIRSGHPELAAPMLESAVASRSENLHALHWLARAYLAMGDPSRAKSSLERAQRLGGNVETHTRLAECELALDQPAAALAHAVKAVALDPGVSDGHLWRGRALDRLDRKAEALAALEEAIRQDPRSSDAHYRAGVVLDQMRRPDEAEAHFREAIAIAPELGFWSHVGLVRLALANRRFDLAAGELEAARALSPKHEAVLRLDARLRRARERGEAHTEGEP